MRFLHSKWVDHDGNPLPDDAMGETPTENGVGELTPENMRPEDPREVKPPAKAKDPRTSKGAK